VSVEPIICCLWLPTHLYRQHIASNVSFTRPPWNWSDRFDDVYARHLNVCPLPSDDNGTLPLPQNRKGGPFESSWEGEWYVSRPLSWQDQRPVLLPFPSLLSILIEYIQLPCPVSDTEVVMVSRPVQCQLREYICKDAESSLHWAGSNDDDDELSRAWLPKGVEFEESMVSTDSLNR
jgi:hypothetical protein